MATKFEVGDVVTLASGGPGMTVMSVADDGMVKVAYFCTPERSFLGSGLFGGDPEGQSLSFYAFPSAALAMRMPASESRNSSAVPRDAS